VSGDEWAVLQLVRNLVRQEGKAGKELTWKKDQLTRLRLTLNYGEGRKEASGKPIQRSQEKKEGVPTVYKEMKESV